jgi:hypothetical protein
MQNKMIKTEYFPGVVGYSGLIPESIGYVEDIVDLANKELISWHRTTTGRGNGNTPTVIPELRQGSVIGLNGISKEEKVFLAVSTLKNAANLAVKECLNDYQNSYGYFDLEGEGWALLKYEVGDFFKLHTDASRAYPRQVSTVYYINDDYLGGEINFKYIDLELKPKKDEFLVFPSTNLFSHYAKEVIAGTKYSMPNWFR